MPTNLGGGGGGGGGGVAMVSSTTTSTAPSPPDMSTKIGGRIVSPALPVVDATPPTELERTFQVTLDQYITQHIPIESTEGIQRRERALNRIGELCRRWIHSVCVRLQLPRDVTDNAGGQLYTSGSYRLGVHEPGADIDAVLVAPSMCTREDFFGSNYAPPRGDRDYDDDDDDDDDMNPSRAPRDPHSLAEMIRNHPDVTNFVPVENAVVPIITFDWDTINIDLLFARLNSSTSVPPTIDINDDAILDGVDPATEKSLNGPRVTNLIAALVSARGTTTTTATTSATSQQEKQRRYQTFLTVVRCVRKWAKARGLYSNKMGYWGGVNINIAVALCVQLYPNATPSSLLRKFFLVFKSWRWPNPVLLTKPHDAGYGLPVWNPIQAQNARQVAPIITPAYPAMNSTISVSRQTLQILHEEFCRGHDIVDKLWKDHQKRQRDGNSSNKMEKADLLDGAGAAAGEAWKVLFEPSDFFISYPHYLSACIVGPTEHDAQAWIGYVESRLRRLVSDMLGKSLPLSKIQLWPKKFDACVADKTAPLTHAQRCNSVTYFVGFQIDHLRMRGTSLNVEQQLQHFREWELNRFQSYVNGMDVLVKCFKVKELPKIVFEGIYEGGKLEAMKKRRMLRDSDPKVQEKKRLARLRALKMKMAKMEKKREEMAALMKAKKAEVTEITHEGVTGEGRDDTSRKRKRKESEEKEEEEHAMVAGEMKADTTKEEDQKEGAGMDAESSLTEDEAKVEGGFEEVASTAGIGVGASDATAEETDLLEHALDAIQMEEGAVLKTREEAEDDRRRLLAGELLVEGGGGGDVEDIKGGRFGAEGEENAADGDTRREPLTLEEREAEILRRAGYTVVSDDETVTVGGNMILPWRRPPEIREDTDSNLRGIKKDEEAEVEGASRKGTKSGVPAWPIVQIKFRTKFDIVELDANGHVIDKGDDDFQPSPKWTGRRAGFEFKLGERGLGYYRTGKKVVVPSNTAY